ncbi:MAG: hypothetical protein O2971_19005, partial [Proteobacteria bacterium]|nr:hypothetical protein [Pseudomonadota bacterium]
MASIQGVNRWQKALIPAFAEAWLLRENPREPLNKTMAALPYSQFRSQGARWTVDLSSQCNAESALYVNPRPA